MKSREDLLNEARQEVPEMTVREVHEHLKQGAAPVLLDVRGLDEWERGHLEGAIHIPRGRLESEVEVKAPDKSRDVVVYCAGGVRSLLAAESLKDLGYERVISMEGGFEDWADAGLPAVHPPVPDEERGPENPDLLEAEIGHLEQVLSERKRRLEQANMDRQGG